MSGTPSYLVPLDPLTLDLIQIEEPHAHIHEGVYFTCPDFATNIQIVSPKYWRIAAPNTSRRIHFIATISASAGCRIEFFEAPNINAAGTALSIFNNDRNSPNVATALAFKDTTVNSDGALIDVSKLGGNTVQTKIGGNSRTNIEFILKQNTSYTIKVTADADGLTAALEMQWYEEE